MPRSERRRWWLEYGPGCVCAMCPGREGDEPNWRYMAITLWRLVQWLRIRFAREHYFRVLHECEEQHALGQLDKLMMDSLEALADADAAVLDARCREEKMRVERDAARDALLACKMYDTFKRGKDD